MYDKLGLARFFLPYWALAMTTAGRLVSSARVTPPRERKVWGYPGEPPATKGLRVDV